MAHSRPVGSAPSDMRVRHIDGHSAKGVALAGAAGAAAFAATAAASCITVPPPDLPVIPRHRPTIVHDAVTPPEGPLDAWPADGTFEVPVEIDDPSQAYEWEVFVDYDPYQTNDTPKAPSLNAQPIPPPDGGLALVPFSLPVPVDPVPCPHRIEFLVANSFSSEHTPSPPGGDSVTWLFDGPNGCLYDAGALQDGAFPPDAPPDGPPDVQAGGDR